MNKIKQVSFWFRLFFQAALYLSPALLAFAWIFSTPNNFNPGYISGFGPVPHDLNIPILYSLNASTKLMGFLISCIPLSITMLILYYLVKLFKLYEHAQIFTFANVKYIRNIGWLVLLSQIIRPIYEAMITAALTFQNPHGHRFASISFSNNNLTTLIIALIIILISWVMAEGCKLNDEQKYII